VAVRSAVGTDETASSIILPVVIVLAGVGLVTLMIVLVVRGARRGTEPVLAEFVSSEGAEGDRTGGARRIATADEIRATAPQTPQSEGTITPEPVPCYPAVEPGRPVPREEYRR
jgi:hypothetical protein